MQDIQYSVNRLRVENIAKINAAIWIIVILIYYTVIFLLLTAFVNSQAAVTNSLSPNADLNNPGFDLKGNIFTQDGYCSGKGEAMTLTKEIFCKKLDIDKDDIASCNNVSGCAWSNVTDLFGITITPQGCYSDVNKSFYGINDSFDRKSAYCGSPGLQAEEICETFLCNWYNASTQFNQISASSTNSMATVWDTISWITTFQFDIGWGEFNWIFSLIAFYIPMLILIIALMFMLPFM